MIIVSQDKENITNFENIIYIDFEKNSFDKYVIEAYYGKEDDDYVWLGEYESEKKAKDILKQIARYYRMYQGIKYCDNKVKIGILQEIDKAGQDAFIYTMPED